MRAVIFMATVVVGCGENLTPLPAEPPGALACLPDLDGVITAAEVPVLTGVSVGYAVSDDERSVDVEGAVDADGGRLWDWSGSTGADDPVVAVSAEPLAEQWYAESFPGGEFVSALDVEGTIEGVYRGDEGGLELLGFASRAENPAAGRTLVVYDQPVAVYRFPLTIGAAWTAVGGISAGTINGVPFVGEDRYTISVDAAGELALPDVTFEQALRVRTSFARVPSSGPPLTRKQVSFVFECFGEVARATSRGGESEEDFTVAAEVRRIVLGATAKEP